MRNNLDATSLILQLYSLILLIQDYNNSDIMGELQKQDIKYFEKIIKNQEEILTLLRKEEKQCTIEWLMKLKNT